ncbi:MAG: DsbA family protein [Anaerolineae bacterium]
MENVTDTPITDIDKPKNEATAAAPTQEIFVIPREAFNYVIVAMVFLIVGTLIGFGLANANEAENRAIISQAVAAALESGGNIDTASGNNAVQYVDVSADNDPSIGAADAPVTIIEFGDFRCSFCRRFESETLPQIMANYEGRVRYVFRDMPILGQASLDAAVAAECANAQGRFWDYHNVLYNNQQLIGATADVFSTMAQSVGLDINTFNACVSAQTTLGEVVADQSEGQRAGIQGTPTFFINGRYVSGAQPYEVFASIIDEELVRATESTTAG